MEKSSRITIQSSISLKFGPMAEATGLLAACNVVYNAPQYSK